MSSSYAKFTGLASSSGGGGGGSVSPQSSTFTLSSSQILNLPSTPVALLPAVSGKVISLQFVDWKYNFNSTAYVLSPGSSSILVSYTSDIGVYFYANNVVQDTGFLDQTSNQEIIQTNASVATEGFLRNQGLSISTAETSITNGDGTLTLILYYYILQ